MRSTLRSLPRLARALLVLLAPLAANAECLRTQIATPGATAPRHYRLEVADTPEKRRHGLMDRDHIGPCDGMVFFFPTLAPQKFWMKNTRLPLDILFVDADNRVIDIVRARPYSETPVGPDMPVSSVIEIDGGRAARDAIHIGDVVSYDVSPANR